MITLDDSGLIRKDVIVNAVTATPASDPTNRARTALYLIATSPAFNVNR